MRGRPRPHVELQLAKRCLRARDVAGPHSLEETHRGRSASRSGWDGLGDDVDAGLYVAEST
jgi:hypothetical protein